MTKRCCATCVNATRPKGHWIRIILSRWPGLLFCCNCTETQGDYAYQNFPHGPPPGVKLPLRRSCAVRLSGLIVARTTATARLTVTHRRRNKGK